MIVTRTPLRIGLAGGGTDLESSVVAMGEPGMVINLSINKYVYVTVKKHSDLFEERYRLNYSNTETVNSRDLIKNEIIKCCLEYLEIDEKLYISSISDIPAGTGLGSSSAFTVGLLHALHVYRGNVSVTQKQLAEQAVHVELNLVKSPIGVQDQYGCAFGGIKAIEIHQSQLTYVSRQIINSRLLNELTDRISLYWTGRTRSANAVLEDQVSVVSENKSKYLELKKDAQDLMSFIESWELDSIGQIIGQSWTRKKALSQLISSFSIDALIDVLYSQGATGCKLLGAGNGGFILAVHDKNKRIKSNEITNPISVKPDVIGSTVIASV